MKNKDEDVTEIIEDLEPIKSLESPIKREGIIEDIINDFNKIFKNKAKIDFIENNQIEITIDSVSMQILLPGCIGTSSKGQ